MGKQINLSGLELRLLPGAIMVYLDVPMHVGRTRLFSEGEAGLLQNLSERLMETVDKAYVATNVGAASSRDALIRRRLDISIDWQFSVEELPLVIEVLEGCIREIENGGDLNVHFNGNEYGINVDHFRNLVGRLTLALSTP